MVRSSWHNDQLSQRFISQTPTRDIPAWCYYRLYSVLAVLKTVNMPLSYKQRSASVWYCTFPLIGDFTSQKNYALIAATLLYRPIHIKSEQVQLIPSLIFRLYFKL